MTRNETAGCARASRLMASMSRENSRAVDFRNFRLAGVLKNNWRTVTTVPPGMPMVSSATISPPSIRSRRPAGAPAGALAISMTETAAMLGRASPRKPNDWMASRSPAVAILLVAKRWTARRTSSGWIPDPSSPTRISAAPAPSTSIRICVAWASRLFSTNSFTTDAGRSTTSPAAMRSAMACSRTLMRFIVSTCGLLVLRFAPLHSHDFPRGRRHLRGRLLRAQLFAEFVQRRHGFHRSHRLQGDGQQRVFDRRRRRQ